MRAMRRETSGTCLRLAGLKFYTTGDSEFDARLLEVAQYAPDVLLVCINGKWGNMTSAEAVELTRQPSPQGCHPDALRYVRGQQC